MNQPLVTIGLPAFKARHFAAALESWKKQNYDRFEVIVVDDASPENLEDIFNRVCAGDARFSYTRNEHNSSPNFVRNWNATLERANGEYFVLGSDDDLYAPDFLTKMVALASNYPEVDVFRSPFDIIDAADEVIGATLKSAVLESQTEFLYGLLVGGVFTVVPNFLVRTTALRAIGGFVDLPAAWGSDWLTWGALASNGVVSAQERLFKWRKSGENVSSATSSRFWNAQKRCANQLAKPLWKALLESVECNDDFSKVLLAEIKRVMIDSFDRLSIEPCYYNDGLVTFIRYAQRQYLSEKRDCVGFVKAVARYLRYRVRK